MAICPLVSLFMSWIPAFFGFLGVDKVNADDKPGFFNRLRKPGIVYNAFRTIAAIILCARARQTRTVPSNLTTGSVAASLMSQLVGWEEAFDLYSIVTILCTVILRCLNIYQIVLGGAFRATGDSPYAFGYGAIRLIGGNCPRLLGDHEDCKNLVASGCGDGSGVAGDLLSHVRVIGMFQAYVGMVITTIIGPLMSYVLWHVLNYYGKANARHVSVCAMGVVAKTYAMICLTVLMCCIAVFALHDGMGYVDASIASDTSV